MILPRRLAPPRQARAFVGHGRVLSITGAALRSCRALWMVVLYYHGASLDRLYYGTDTRVAEILLGAVLAVVLARAGHRVLRTGEERARDRRHRGVRGHAWGWANLGARRHAHVARRHRRLLATHLRPHPGGDRRPRTGRRRSRVASRSRTSAASRYGLYLYHWPIFLWLTEDRTGLIAAGRCSRSAVALTFAGRDRVVPFRARTAGVAGRIVRLSAAACGSRSRRRWR